MRHFTFRRLVAALCVGTGLAVLCGWRYPFVPHGWMCGSAQMVPASAICFILIGVERWFKGNAVDVVTCAGILSVLINITLDETLKPSEHSYAIIVDPPSLLTSIAFLVFCAGNLLGFSGTRTRVVGVIIAAIGVTALVGHAIGVLIMAGYIHEHSGAMAIHSAALFVLVGITQMRRVK